MLHYLGQFRAEAFLTATYLINLLPTLTLKHRSPFPTLLHKPPDYKFLRTFGCACYLLLRPYHQHKLDFHSKQCIFLGYVENHKGYKCLSKLVASISQDMLTLMSNYFYILLCLVLLHLLLLRLPLLTLLRFHVFPLFLILVLRMLRLHLLILLHMLSSSPIANTNHDRSLENFTTQTLLLPLIHL